MNNRNSIIVIMGLAAAISIFNSFTNQTLAESTIEKNPLAKAAFQGDLAQLEAALNGGAAVNGRDEQNSTALHWASNPEGILKFPEGDHVACVRKLIAAGADVNAVNESSETPLYRAVFRSKIAGILLEHGADPNKGQLTRTPLISAAFMGGASCAEGVRSMELLVGAGADVNAQESGISNALATAGIFGCPQMIEFLIGHGAEVNARFANGETALGFYEALRNNSRRFHIHACRRRRPFTEHHADPPCWWNRLILETAVARTNKLRYRNPMGT